MIKGDRDASTGAPEKPQWFSKAAIQPEVCQKTPAAGASPWDPSPSDRGGSVMGRLIGVVVAGLLSALSVAHADEAKTFTITINGVDYAIDEGETRTVKGKDGAELRLSLHKNEIGTFHGDFVSFQLTKGFSVTSSQLETDIKQHMLS